MKLILVLLLPSILMANDFLGATIKKRFSKERIGLVCIERIEKECLKATFALEKNGEKSEVNPKLIIGLGAQDRYERAPILTKIIVDTSLNRAPFPYAWFMFNMRFVTSKLRKVFFHRLFTEKEEDRKYSETLSKNNFKAFIEVLQRFE